MPAYTVRVLDDEGRLVVGATINCVDDAAAKAKFKSLPLPAGAAELSQGSRVVLRSDPSDTKRAAKG
ncbi:hypothetical protein [Phenylobacterium sp.]|jgi:hypothetical protein|uniref:hypothetical protein n=1 Tax=Phenylobacterium sp. TaxID=1871053 RepID=UPI002F932B85